MTKSHARGGTKFLYVMTNELLWFAAAQNAAASCVNQKIHIDFYMPAMTTPRALTVFFMVAMLVYGAVLSVSAYGMYGSTETAAQQKATKASQQQKSAARKASQSAARKAAQPRIANTQTLRQVQSPVEMWEMAIAQPVAWHPDRGDSVAPSPSREEAERARDATGWNPNPAILVGLGIALISIFRRFRRF